MTDVKQIVLYPNEVLTQATKPVGVITDEVKAIAEELKKMMTGRGVGLSANQLGYDKSIFCMFNPRGVTVCVDPEITSAGTELDLKQEGCLSLPTVHTKVSRPREINVKYTNLEGVVVEDTLTGMQARIFQHELDHLKGKLIIDYLPTIIRKFTLEKYHKRK